MDFGKGWAEVLPQEDKPVNNNINVSKMIIPFFIVTRYNETNV